MALSITRILVQDLEGINLFRSYLVGWAEVQLSSIKYYCALWK